MNWPRAHALRFSGGHPPAHTADRRSFAIARSADRRYGRPKLLSGGVIGAPAVVVNRGAALHLAHLDRHWRCAFETVCAGVSGTRRDAGVVEAEPAHRSCTSSSEIESRTHRPDVTGAATTRRVWHAPFRLCPDGVNEPDAEYAYWNGGSRSSTWHTPAAEGLPGDPSRSGFARFGQSSWAVHGCGPLRS